MHRLKFLPHEHALHASPRSVNHSHMPHALGTASSRATTCLPHIMFCHVSPRVTSLCHVIPRQHLMLAHINIPSRWQNCWPSHWLWLDRWPLIVDFDQSQNISTGPVLLSFLRRIWFWASFLHLRFLNPIFCSFSSLWLNKTTEISYILSPLCWMVLLAIMHDLKIWLSFSKVINCGDMWLVQFLSSTKTYVQSHSCWRCHQECWYSGWLWRTLRGMGEYSE